MKLVHAIEKNSVIEQGLISLMKFFRVTKNIKNIFEGLKSNVGNNSNILFKNNIYTTYYLCRKITIATDHTIF